MGGDIRLFPPTLDNTNYAVWKVRIHTYAMGKKHEVWSMMVNGVDKEMVNGVDKEYEKFTKEEMEVNGSAKNIIFASISDNLFHQVSS